MEKKEIQEWRDRLIKMFGIYHSDGQEYITCPLCGINLDELAKHMIEELDKAREEVITDVFKAGHNEMYDKDGNRELLKLHEYLCKKYLSKLKDNK